MSASSTPTVLVPGGAGFIGSHIAKRFVDGGYHVIVIDGLLDKTGGRIAHLDSIFGQIEFIKARIEEVPDLTRIIDRSEIVVDCMAWTAHMLAISDPEYDLQLNVGSHLHLINHLRESKSRNIIYLGSRGQYGNYSGAEISEDIPMVPVDIQGIHKLAAESHYRVYAKANNWNVVSLRFPNCFGENQPLSGPDIGLVGGFIRDLLDGRNIEIFGANRVRNLVYARDLAEVVYLVSRRNLAGFTPLNMAGQLISLEDLAKLLVEFIGKGSFTNKPLPKEIANIDTGTADFSEQKLANLLGSIPRTKIKTSLLETITYFKSAQDE